MLEPYTRVATNRGKGVIERIDTESYSIPMYIIRLDDNTEYPNVYIVKSKSEIVDLHETLETYGC